MDFHSWLQEEIDCDGFPRKRSECIRDFVKNGLYPAVKSKGYEFSISDDKLMNYLANALFDSAGKSCLEAGVSYRVTNTNWNEDEKAHFYYVLNYDFWGNFWFAWGKWEDVSLDDFRGPDRRIDIQEFVWGYIDLEASFQTGVLYDLMYAGEEDDAVAEPSQTPRKQTNDIYLQETVEYNGWGGYRK